MLGVCFGLVGLFVGDLFVFFAVRKVAVVDQVFQRLSHFMESRHEGDHEEQ